MPSNFTYRTDYKAMCPPLTTSALYGHFCKIHRILESSTLLIYVIWLFSAV